MPSEAANQLALVCSLVSLLSTLYTLDPWLPTECPAKTDYTTGWADLSESSLGSSTCNFVGNAVPQFMFHLNPLIMTKETV